MDLVAAPTFRRRVPADMPDAYRVFRRSLFDYLFRTGQVDAETAADPPIESGWATQQPWMEHLAATAAEDWVAQGPNGEIIGWAQSTERDGLLELTLFFVDPLAQSRGVGRGLLDRTFPRGRGSARTIVATQDPRALSLYLRYDVGFVTTSAELIGRPSAFSVASDLAMDRVEPGQEEAAVIAAGAIERAILGHGRAEDVRFLLGYRPAWLARRDDRVVGVAFGASGTVAGPVAALDPADLPALLAAIESDAADRGLDEITFTVPMVNVTALQHLLSRRFQIDPFYAMILAGKADMALDRWVHTGPAFIV